MREETVTFAAPSGEQLVGLLRRPDHPGPYPAVVQGPGWLGLKDAKLYVPYHEAFTAAGYAVLIFDYRGFGDSEGDRRVVSPTRQLQDLAAAVTYLAGHREVDASRMGVFGSGGTGGGNAILLAASDPRINCAVSQVPVADGADWLRRMRSDDGAWNLFLKRVDADRGRRAAGEPGELVDPREDIMVPTAERRATTVKRDVDGRVNQQVWLACTEEVLAYRPIDHVAGLAGLMVVAVAGDEVTPTDHAESLFGVAAAPKRLVLQHNTTHYAAYEQYRDVVIPRMVDWFDTHAGGPVGSAVEVEEVGL